VYRQGSIIWLPSLDTQRTKSVTEIIHCYFKYSNKQKALSKGKKPENFPANKAVTKKDWARSSSPTKDPINPVSIGLKFIKYLDDNTSATYDDIAAAISKVIEKKLFVF
jgi:hypothetical protein